MEDGSYDIREMIAAVKAQGVPPHAPLEEGSFPFKARLTCMSTVHFQIAGEQPQSRAMSFTENLNSNDDAYSRRLKIEPELQTIDFGWVEKPSYVLIENLTGQNLQRNPSKEEAAEMSKKIVQYSSHRESIDDGFLVHPGRFAIVSPTSLMYIQSLSGQTVVRITAYPE